MYMRENRSTSLHFKLRLECLECRSGRKWTIYIIKATQHPKNRRKQKKLRMRQDNFCAQTKNMRGLEIFLRGNEYLSAHGLNISAQTQEYLRTHINVFWNK